MHPRVDDLVDAAVIGIEDFVTAHLRGLRRQGFIAGNDRGLADARDRACDTRGTVAVDHEPRIALRDQMRAQMIRQLLGDAGNADVPGDVAGQFSFGHAEITERAGNDFDRNDRR